MSENTLLFVCIGGVIVFAAGIILLGNYPGDRSNKSRARKMQQDIQKDNLIDEFIISLVQVLVGNGTKLFKDGRPEQLLKLVSVKPFDTGLTQLHYKSAGA